MLSEKYFKIKTKTFKYRHIMNKIIIIVLTKHMSNYVQNYTKVKFESVNLIVF